MSLNISAGNPLEIAAAVITILVGIPFAALLAYVVVFAVSDPLGIIPDEEWPNEIEDPILEIQPLALPGNQD